MQKRILIFGATGRTGQVLKRIAEQAGYEVLAPAPAECPLENRRQAATLGQGVASYLEEAAAH